MAVRYLQFQEQLLLIANFIRQLHKTLYHISSVILHNTGFGSCCNESDFFSFTAKRISKLRLYPHIRVIAAT